MVDPADSRRDESPDADARVTLIDSIEAYETEDTVVLYDARDPLAWIESTAAFTLPDAI